MEKIKNPVVLGIAIVVVIIVIIIIFIISRSIRDKKEIKEIKETFIDTFSNPSDTFSLKTITEQDKQIIEYFPSPEMNVMYSDANGNLATTRDLGLSNLTVSGDSKLGRDVIGGISATLGDRFSQFRAKHGNYGTMLRQDGDNFYILTTTSGSPDGGWNNLVPFYINNANGNVTMGHNVNVGGTVSVSGALSTAGNASVSGALSTGGEIKTDSNLAIGPSRKFVFEPGTDNWLRLKNASGAHGTHGLAATNLYALNVEGNPNFSQGLSVTGNASVSGALTSGTLTAGTTTVGSLTSGALNASSVTTGGNATVTGTLTAGTTTVGSLTSGALSASSISSTADISASGVLKQGGYELVPPGIITMWSGAITAVPGGWRLCDGKNNTPDLSGRFILGYNASGGKDSSVPGSDYNVIKGVGGAESHTLTVSQMPAHTHRLYSDDYADELVAHNRSFTGGEGLDRTIKLRAGDSNMKSVNAAATGGGGKHNNMPPYYVLAYIIKL